MLQSEFRFWSFRRRFFVCNGGGGCRVFRQKGLSCNPNGILLEGKEALLLCKTTTIAMQMRLFWSAKVALLKRNGVFFNVLKLHSCIGKRYNSLSTSMIIAARSKLTNFELKISSRVQLAVLSGLKCKYSNEAQLAPVEKVRCWWGVVCQLNHHNYT